MTRQNGVPPPGNSTANLNAESKINLTGTLTSGGDIYTGLDRFGRVQDQYWFDGSGDTLARYQYGYDNDGNVLYMNDLTSGGTAFSSVYTYDPLDRLSSWEQGTLNSTDSGISGTAAQSQTWGLDTFGNWNTLAVDGTTYDSATNSDNELTAFESSTTNQTFDADGNQLTSSTGYTYTYNAWDEMVSSSITGSGTTEYTYNALGQRITIGSGVGSGSTMQYQYYSAAGQVIETDEVFDGTGSAISQYVWGLAYQNDLLVRDDNSSDGCYGAGYSSLGRRIFAIEDANFDVTGLVDTFGSVVQRFGYTPYGVQTVLSPIYVGTTDGYSFEVGFQGGITDPATGLIRFGVRDYDPVTGRWTEPEPFGSAYVDGPNLYQAFGDNPGTDADPTGLYAFAGHFWTTYIVAVASGMQPNDAFELAYYSQLPDANPEWNAIDVTKELLETLPGEAMDGGLDVVAQINYDHDLLNYLHSLHGGGPTEVAKRRCCLRNLLRSGKLTEAWQKGFVIHALGDSYAHIDDDGSAFAFPFGHFKLFGGPPWGKEVDSIYHSTPAYAAYVQALFSGLGGNSNPNADYSVHAFLVNTSHLGAVAGLDTDLNNDANALRIGAHNNFGYNFMWTPGLGDTFLPIWFRQKLVKPSTQQVRTLLKLIKNSCT